jgi:hypothetical protein
VLSSHAYSEAHTGPSTYCHRSGYLLP